MQPDAVHHQVHLGFSQVTIERLLNGALRFRNAFGREVYLGQVVVREDQIRAETHGLQALGNGLVETTHRVQNQAQVVVRNRIARIGLLPHLIDRLLAAIRVGQDLAVPRVDVQAFDLADPVPPRVCLVGVACDLLESAEVPERSGDPRVGHGEVRIDFDGAEEQRHGISVAVPAAGFVSGVVGLQRFKRSGCRLLDWGVESLQHGERLAEFSTQTRGGLIQGSQYLLPRCRFRLFTGDRLAGAAVRRRQSNHVIGSKRRDASVDRRGGTDPLTEFPRHLAGNAIVRRSRHQRQRPANPIRGNDAEEGRLLELDDHRLLQGAVEERVAGRIDEIGDDDGVAIGQRRRRPRIEERADSCRNGRERSAGDRPSSQPPRGLRDDAGCHTRCRGLRWRGRQNRS